MVLNLHHYNDTRSLTFTKCKHKVYSTLFLFTWYTSYRKYFRSQTGGKAIVKTCIMIRKGKELNKNIGSKNLHEVARAIRRQQVAKRQVLMRSQQNCSKQEDRHHHHQFHVADEGRRFVAPPCPRSTARLQRSPIGRAESFRSWSTHFFRGRPGGRRHVRSRGRLSDMLTWSWRANVHLRLYM